jgi:hypothetical protein
MEGGNTKSFSTLPDRSSLVALAYHARTSQHFTGKVCRQLSAEIAGRLCAGRRYDVLHKPSHAEGHKLVVLVPRRVNLLTGHSLVLQVPLRDTIFGYDAYHGTRLHQSGRPKTEWPSCPKGVPSSDQHAYAHAVRGAFGVWCVAVGC